MLLGEFATVSLIDGRRAVVRNGYLPARAILTTVGPVEVQVPKVRDRSGSGVKFNSALAPPYVRRSARVAAALPWLYLKGISSGDLGEALEVLVGDGAKGLSPAALGRLKAEWSEDYQGWTRRRLVGKEYADWWADGIYTVTGSSAASFPPRARCGQCSPSFTAATGRIDGNQRATGAAQPRAVAGADRAGHAQPAEHRGVLPGGGCQHGELLQLA